MNILLLSRYDKLGASSRIRFYQYFPYLESKGININSHPFFSDEYLKSFYSGNGKPINEVIGAYTRRIYTLLKAGKFDLVWLECEALPWLPNIFEKLLDITDVPLVVDYDDAIFHRYDTHSNFIIRWMLGRKINAVMRRADLVIAGNEYIKEYALRAGSSKVVTIPSVVDTQRYINALPVKNTVTTIGWIGSPATAHNLHLIEPALCEIVKTRKVRVVAVGANAAQLEGLPVTSIPWTEESEVEQIRRFDIGIMPLPDEPFERGKCGYKLIQCMACGKTVVASPVGANSEIVRDGVEGFLASSQADWVRFLTRLIDDFELRTCMGDAARVRVENEYSLSVTAPKLERLLRSVVEY